MHTSAPMFTGWSTEGIIVFCLTPFGGFKCMIFFQQSELRCNQCKESTPQTDDLYDLFQLDDLDPSGQIDS